jgi:hypothetical protein
MGHGLAIIDKKRGNKMMMNFFRFFLFLGLSSGEGTLLSSQVTIIRTQLVTTQINTRGATYVMKTSFSAPSKILLMGSQLGRFLS